MIIDCMSRLREGNVFCQSVSLSVCLQRDPHVNTTRDGIGQLHSVFSIRLFLYLLCVCFRKNICDIYIASVYNMSDSEIATVIHIYFLAKILIIAVWMSHMFEAEIAINIIDSN